MLLKLVFCLVAVEIILCLALFAYLDPCEHIGEFLEVYSGPFGCLTYVSYVCYV